MKIDDTLSDNDIEQLTYQVLKFHNEDPLDEEELSEQVFEIAKWANQSRINAGLFQLVVDGEIVIGFDRKTGQLKFRKNDPTVEATIVEHDDDNDVIDDYDPWVKGPAYGY